MQTTVLFKMLRLSWLFKIFFSSILNLNFKISLTPLQGGMVDRGPNRLYVSLTRHQNKRAKIQTQ